MIRKHSYRLGGPRCRRLGNNAGVTLLEMMFVVGIIVVVTGMVMGMAIGMGDTARVQNAKITTSDEARRAMITISRDLRQAAKGSFAGIPGSTVNFRAAVDIDGNGYAVDVAGNIELSPQRFIGRDVEDLNGDGVRDTQLVRQEGDTVIVLANGLMPDEDVNRNGTLDQGEDINGNGVLDHGMWFEQIGQSIRATVQARGMSRQGHSITSTLNEVILPRN